jgi:hypothetical protein
MSSPQEKLSEHEGARMSEKRVRENRLLKLKNTKLESFGFLVENPIQRKSALKTKIFDYASSPFAPPQKPRFQEKPRVNS